MRRVAIETVGAFLAGLAVWAVAQAVERLDGVLSWIFGAAAFGVAFVTMYRLRPTDDDTEATYRFVDGVRVDGTLSITDTDVTTGDGPTRVITDVETGGDLNITNSTFRLGSPPEGGSTP